MDISRLKMRNDNVLVCFSHHEKARETEDRTEGGIFIPRSAGAPKDNEAILATVLAVGPGHYADPFVNHEVGTDPYKTGRFIPVEECIKPGAKVLLEGAARAGDRIYSDDRMEYRCVKAHCICAIVEEE